MSLISVDKDKCKKDGICIDECPVKIIHFPDKSSTPETFKGAEDFCINCGHCTCVCPVGALSHINFTPDTCPPIQKELLPTAEQAAHFLRFRRSIRTFKDKNIDKNKLEKVIDIARFAPSGHNFQPVEWTIVYEKTKVKKLTGMVIDWMRSILKALPKKAAEMHLDFIIAAWETGSDTVCRNVPHLIIAHGDKNNPTTHDSCVIAMTYLELTASSMDLGCCWAGYFNVAAQLWEPLKKELNLPLDHLAYGTMMIGIPKYKYHRLPTRKKSTISWI